MRGKVKDGLTLFDGLRDGASVFRDEGEVWSALVGLCSPENRSGLILYSHDDGQYSLLVSGPGASSTQDAFASRGLSMISARETPAGECLIVARDGQGADMEFSVRPVGPALLGALSGEDPAREAGAPGQDRLSRAFEICGEARVSSPQMSPEAACLRARVAEPHDRETLSDWFWQRDACLRLEAREWPACWGGNYRVDEGEYVSQEAFERALPSPRDRSLWIALANLGPTDDTLSDDVISHLGDGPWLNDLAAFSVGLDDAPVFFTEERPEWVSEPELSLLLSERPDLVPGALGGSGRGPTENPPIANVAEAPSHAQPLDDRPIDREGR